MERQQKISDCKKYYILNISDINYLISIIDSNISDTDKAEKIYTFCNDATIRASIAEYSGNHLKKEVEKLKRIQNMYLYYESKGYFEKFKNSYRCTNEELDLRLNKLNELMSIVNSQDTDYNKAEKLLLLYDSLKNLKKSYSLLIRYGKNDSKLDKARIALDNIDKIISTYTEYEEKGILGNIRYMFSVYDYFENYDYAKFVIDYYISSPDSYITNKFLEELGISKEIFDFCVDTIAELDVDMYNDYLKKKEQNRKINYSHVKFTISDLANGIKTGMLSDGTSFDMLEFFKRIPFKKSEDFMHSLIEFCKRNNEEDYNIIMSYIHKNKLDFSNTFKPLNVKEVYDTKTIINGVELTNEDKDTIIEYLKSNNIPVVSKTYNCAKIKYINGNITKDMIKKQNVKEKSKSKILIPSIKR